jgi:hypothetical protein
LRLSDLPASAPAAEIERAPNQENAMFSPALRHRQRVLAREAAKTAAAPRAKRTLAGAAASTALTPPAEGSQAGTEYAALLAVLHENLRSLSDIQSHEARLPKKAEYAAQFANWVDGVIEADEPVQDEIVVTMLIWALDCHDWSRALHIAQFVLGHGLELPERYSRTAACFLAEEIAEVALKDPEAVPLGNLAWVQAHTAGADMPDQVRAKLTKAIGRGFAVLADAFDPAADNAPAGGKAAYVAEALTNLRRALQLDEKAGVKKDIERLEREQKKLADDAQKD